MYDEKCLELAQAFLSDYPYLDNSTNQKALAQDIQTTIEDFLYDLENPDEED